MGGRRPSHTPSNILARVSRRPHSVPESSCLLRWLPLCAATSRLWPLGDIPQPKYTARAPRLPPGSWTFSNSARRPRPCHPLSWPPKPHFRSQRPAGKSTLPLSLAPPRAKSSSFPEVLCSDISHSRPAPSFPSPHGACVSSGRRPSHLDHSGSFPRGAPGPFLVGFALFSTWELERDFSRMYQ